MNNQHSESGAPAEKGLILVYTGNGKGKTTAALGLAVRAIGHGKNVLIVQFMKGKKYGEVLCAEKYLTRLTFRQCGLDSFVNKNHPSAADIELAMKGLEIAKAAIASNEYELVILDEINVAIDFNLIPLDRALEVIKSKPDSLDLVLTGRNAPEAIMDLADMVSEVKELKHHYMKKIKQKAGIEF